MANDNLIEELIPTIFTSQDQQNLDDLVNNAEVIAGHVNTFADLPDVALSVGQKWIVDTGTGIWGVNRKPAGTYLSTGTIWTSKYNAVDVINSLTSTQTQKALSANMGKTLQDTKENIFLQAEDVYVDKNGNDGTGTGSLSNPFLTIAAAITYINTQSPSEANPFTLRVGTGTFSEAAFTVPKGTRVLGSNSNLIASDPTNDFITLQNQSTLDHCNVLGVTTTAKYCVVIAGQTLGLSTVVACNIGSGSKNGIKVTSAGATHTLNITNSTIVGFDETGIRAESNTTIAMGICAVIGTGTSARGLATDGDGSFQIATSQIQYCLIGVYHNSTSLFEANGLIIDSTNAVPLERVGTSPIKSTLATSMELEKVVSSSVDNLFGSLTDISQGKAKFRVLDEASFGLPGAGIETVMGEGDSYVNGMIVFTNDGATNWVNETAAASSGTSSTFTFQGTGAGNAIYLSSGRRDKDDTDYLKFFSQKIETTIAAVLGGGEIIAEYWNGAWVEFNHMSTEATTPFQTYAKNIFERVGTEQLRFDPDINDDWAVSDPVPIGISTYWIRFRILTAITTAPTFERWKVGTNRTELDKNGFMEFFDFARPTGSLPFDVSTFRAANNSPANRDVYLSDNLGVGRLDNRFQTGVVDRSSMVLPLPPDIDTSHAIEISLEFFSEVAGGDFDLTLRAGTSKITDNVYPDAASAPTTAPNEQSHSATLTNVAIHTQFKHTFEIDVSDIVAVDASGNSEYLWMSIERDGTTDANTGDLVLIQLGVAYLKWSNGGSK